jgi:uroporphyrinogen-III synthase
MFQTLEGQISMEKLWKVYEQRITVMARSPATANTLLEMGLKVDVMPRIHVFEEALTTLARYWIAE